MVLICTFLLTKLSPLFMCILTICMLFFFCPFFPIAFPAFSLLFYSSVCILAMSPLLNMYSTNISPMLWLAFVLGFLYAKRKSSHN